MKYSLAILLTVLSITYAFARINGVSLVAPAKPFEKDPVVSVCSINGNWVAVSPFAYCKPGETTIRYNSPRQWWGERKEGIISSIDYAHSNGLNVMLKPQMWNHEQGWMGDFDLSSDAEWEAWEQSYRAYILPLASLADSMQVGMFCVGTEIRHSARKRPQFWSELIKDVREVYEGKLTYASNWDNYQEVKFWGALDFIGIDAYWPLSDEATPQVDELMKSWLEPMLEMEEFSNALGRQVLFTEYGYRSTDHAAGKQWELEDDWIYRGEGNLVVQKNAFEAIFKTFWTKDWFAGGFIWKWYHNHEVAGGKNNTDYTPQNKPVEEVIKYYYGK